MAKRSRSDLLGDDPPKRGRPKGTGDSAPRVNITDERNRLYAAQAELAETRARKLKGELVAAADVARRWQTEVIEFRQRLLAIPARLSKDGLTRQQVAKLEKEITAALNALAEAGGPAHAGKP